MIDSNLKKVEGQITSINHEKRGIALQDKEGTIHPMYWAENIKMVNWKGEPLKERWFIQVTAERNEKDDTWWVKDQQYWKKPDDWPVRQSQSGGRKSYGKSPEERKDIRLMNCVNSLTTLATSPQMYDLIDLVFEDKDGKPVDKPLTLTELGIMVAKAAVEMEKVLSGEGK